MEDDFNGKGPFSKFKRNYRFAVTIVIELIMQNVVRKKTAFTSIISNRDCVFVRMAKCLCSCEYWIYINMPEESSKCWIYAFDLKIPRLNYLLKCRQMQTLLPVVYYTSGKQFLECVNSIPSGLFSHFNWNYETLRWLMYFIQLFIDLHSVQMKMQFSCIRRVKIRLGAEIVA